MKHREYNVYLCPCCKFFERHELKKDRQAGICRAEAVPIQVRHDGEEPLMKALPCTEFVREKRK